MFIKETMDVIGAFLELYAPFHCDRGDFTGIATIEGKVRFTFNNDYYMYAWFDENGALQVEDQYGGAVSSCNGKWEISNEDLLHRLVQLSGDFDTYEYKDCFESDEEAYEHIEGMLTEKAGIETLISFCEEVLESEDDALYSEAEKLKFLLNISLAKCTN